MSSPDDTPQTTGAIVRLSRPLDRRALLSERRQSILQQKCTDSLPRLPADTTNGKAARRQVVLLREENRRLHFELEKQRAQMQRQYATPQPGVDKDIAAIHSGYRQEIEQYQRHLREIMDERNRLQEARSELGQRYQELYQHFRDAVDEEARKMVKEAARTIELSVDEPPALLNDVFKTVELHVRQEQSKHVTQVLYYKRELQRMTEQLAQERQQIEAERQQLIALQQSINKQAKVRYDIVQKRLRDRWTAALAFVTISVLVLLIVLQYLFLFLLKVPFTANLTASILGPIVVCVVLALVLAHPFLMLKHMRDFVPHKHKV